MCGGCNDKEIKRYEAEDRRWAKRISKYCCPIGLERLRVKAIKKDPKHYGELDQLGFRLCIFDNVIDLNDSICIDIQSVAEILYN